MAQGISDVASLQGEVEGVYKDRNTHNPISIDYAAWEFQIRIRIAG
jgi:hypothetical protein